MREDAPAGPRGSYGMCVEPGAAVPDSGAQAGRVVQGAETAADGSVLLVREVGKPAGRSGEPALGVMGGLQMFSCPRCRRRRRRSSPRTRPKPTGSNQNPATPAPNFITGSAHRLPPVDRFGARSRRQARGSVVPAQRGASRDRRRSDWPSEDRAVPGSQSRTVHQLTGFATHWSRRRSCARGRAGTCNPTTHLTLTRPTRH